ncbi:hypothetical protein, partial [Schleiferilactobacillus harbinensis]|uniref:hypothetical protein n=1 Tax=Schleiferilactobacillus harbinensis TaxID=304207 RepID=UPI001C9968CC
MASFDSLEKWTHHQAHAIFEVRKKGHLAGRPRAVSPRRTALRAATIILAKNNRQLVKVGRG